MSPTPKYTGEERIGIRRAKRRVRPPDPEQPPDPDALVEDLIWYPTSVHLRQADFEALKILREKYGLVGFGVAIRFAIRVLAAMDPIVLQEQLAAIIQSGPDGEGVRMLMSVPQKSRANERKELEGLPP